MKLVAAVTCVLLVVVPSGSTAQTVSFGIHGVFATHTEIAEDRESDGIGVGGKIRLRLGRFAIEVEGFRVSVEPDVAGASSFDIVQGDVRASVLLAHPISLEVSAGARGIDPEFAAQQVGFVGIGLRAESPLTALATTWVRGAYLVSTEFSGGGETGAAFEFGFGTAVGTPNKRFQVVAESKFQRIDRTVGGIEVPIQLTVVRFGVEVGF